jgi:hypothetical protein
MLQLDRPILRAKAGSRRGAVETEKCGICPIPTPLFRFFDNLLILLGIPVLNCDFSMVLGP